MLLSQFLVSIVSVAGLATAAPQVEAGDKKPPTKCPQTLCIDGINPACPSVRWGGCYDTCKPWTKPKMSPCPRPPRPTKSFTRTTAKPPSPTTFPPEPTSTSDNCSTRTVCADYINSCGMMYGGCFPDCKPWPSFVAPPCPTTTQSDIGMPWPPPADPTA
ncbi:uncharacterized protein CTRU02_205501 [Colletotrichum truncatum]|uniref:Uncharacterized protein n=1 Tax=Colletotrichum truncatum TaxID=5467 RepID=A0ACC3Z462_COLTU|nr:uncharacterized protein CTRU02_04557 [Colletotrichum truncatum]KAF6795747.1 hypothetical protein CTRU02_04557 [Colletotrichum truncatum]